MLLKSEDSIRLTRQRRLVLEILQKNKGHLDADAIHREAKSLDPRISLATVYRSLSILKKAGRIQENRLGENHGHFEASQDPHHFHFTCLRCGRVVELHSSQITDISTALCAKEGLQAVDLRLDIQGYCPQCRENQSENS